MSAVCSPRDQNIADDAADSASRDEHPRTFPPNPIQLAEEGLIIADAT
jgi:hypothetical protein